VTDDALAVVQCIFSNIWRLFSSWNIPGTNVTPAVALIGILFAVVCFRTFSRLLGVWSGSDAHGSGKDDG